MKYRHSQTFSGIHARLLIFDEASTKIHYVNMQIATNDLSLEPNS